MREIGRQRRLRGRAAIGLAAAVAIAVGGSLAATQAQAASSKPATAGGNGLSLSKQFFGSTVEPYTGKNTAVFRYTLRNAQGHEGPDPDLRRDHPGHLGAGPERPCRPT